MCRSSWASTCNIAILAIALGSPWADLLGQSAPPELQQEIDQTKERIQELEAELAAERAKLRSLQAPSRGEDIANARRGDIEITIYKPISLSNNALGDRLSIEVVIENKSVTRIRNFNPWNFHRDQITGEFFYLPNAAIFKLADKHGNTFNLQGIGRVFNDAERQPNDPSRNTSTTSGVELRPNKPVTLSLAFSGSPLDATHDLIFTATLPDSVTGLSTKRQSEYPFLIHPDREAEFIVPIHGRVPIDAE